MKGKLYITIGKEELKKLERIAKQNKRSKSNMIEVLITNYKEKMGKDEI